jgi:hypothetical protein
MRSSQAAALLRALRHKPVSIVPLSDFLGSGPVQGRSCLHLHAGVFIDSGLSRLKPPTGFLVPGHWLSAVQGTLHALLLWQKLSGYAHA